MFDVRVINVSTLSTDYCYYDDVGDSMKFAIQQYSSNKVVSVRVSTDESNDFTEDTSKEIASFGQTKLGLFESKALSISQGQGISFNTLFDLLTDLSANLERLIPYHDKNDVGLRPHEGTT